MSQEHDDRAPWEKAGGYSHADWHRVFGEATRRLMRAEGRLDAFLTRGHWVIGEFGTLKAAIDQAEDERRKVLAGDATTVSRIFADLELERSE